MPTEVNCFNLGLFRKQLKEDGVIKLPLPISEAKLVIVRSLGPVELVEPQESPALDLGIPTTSSAYAQSFIEEARKEAAKSTCWMNGAGSIVVNALGRIVARGHNHPVIPGDFCQSLSVTFDEVSQLLKPGERLNFCQNIHDVVEVIAEAARDGRKIGGHFWYLSMEPCDNCANAVVMVEPQAVFFTIGIGRERYYNSVGLQRLLAAQIPTYFVEMPN